MHPGSHFGLSALLLAVWAFAAVPAAAADCPAEAEPNDTPETAGLLAPGCLTGSFAAGDQEILLLEVDRPAVWSLALSARGAALDLYRLSGDPPMPGSRLVHVEGGAPQPVPVVLVPGRWLLGLSFAGAPGTPWTLTATPAPLAAPAADLRPGAPPLGLTLEPNVPVTLPLVLTPAQARRRWGLGLTAVPAEMLQITLTDAAGRVLAETLRSPSGPAGIDGLGLEAGSYGLTLRALTVQPVPLQLGLSDQGPRLPVREDEPNDRAESARPLKPGKPVTGSLTEGDADLYRLSVEPGPRLLSAMLEGPSSATLSLCLKDAAGVDVQCRYGAAVELGDLALPPGDWFLAVSGSLPGGGDYRLSLRPGPPRAARGGHEPNDTSAQAQPLLPAVPVTGAFAGQDQDRFALIVEGAPQLWRVTATGATSLRIEDPGGYPLVTAFGTPDQPIVAQDLYLAQGRHILALDGGGTDYTLRAEPTGPPAAGAEVEPNDSVEAATLLVPGVPRQGRLSGAADVDILRFTLDRDGPMALSLSLPDGGEAVLQMSGGGEVRTETLPAEGLTFARDWVAGEYVLQLSPLLSADPVPWQARLDWADPFGPPGPVAGARLTGALPVAELAAHWPWGQRLEADLLLTAEAAGDWRLDGLAALPGAVVTVEPAAASLAAGESRTLRLTLALPPDLPALAGVPLVVRAQDAAGGASGGGEVRLPLALTLAPGAPAQGSHTAFRSPAALLGGFNIASPGFGGRFPAEDGQDRGRPTPDNPLRLTDGFADPSPYVSAPPLAALRLDFGAREPVPVAGVVMSPFALLSLPFQSRLRQFELALSADGVTFRPVLAGTLGDMPGDVAFALPEPVPAVAAELRFLAGSGTPAEGIALSDWAVIAAPGWPAGTAINLADPARGGHVVRSLPLLAADEAGLEALLLPGDPEQTLDPGTAAPEVVIGFAGSRRARLAAVEWQEAAVPLPEGTPWPALAVFAADSPTGPWHPLGELPPAALRRLEFAAPVTARYLRLAAAAPAEGLLVPPAQIRVIEVPVAADSLSAAGWWDGYGTASPLDPAPEAVPEAVPEAAPEGAGGAIAGTAAAPGLLGWGATVGGLVVRDRDTDHWALEVPPGETRALLRLTGQPTVLARLALADAAGQPVPLRRLPAGPGEMRYEAAVTPGARYAVTVDEPPRNIMIGVDVSGSLGPFWSAVRSGLWAMAEGMVPGRDHVRLIPFDGVPAGDWTDDPVILRRVLAGMSILSTGSGTEQTVLKSLVDLQTREGVKSLLLLTDGATSSFPDRPAMWQGLDLAGVQVFAAHLGGWDNPAAETRLLMDLARVGGGAYAHLQTQAGIDRALARVSAWTRAPARYGLTVGRSDAPPPAPGTLALERPAPAAGGVPPAPAAADLAALRPDPAAEGAAPPPALELILDASGSMLQRLGAERRVDLARAALVRIVMRQLPPGQPVALRVFGDTVAGSCDSNLRVPLMPLWPEGMVAAIAAAEPVNLAKTPIAASLTAAGGDLAGATGRKVIVLLTDGEETCGGDPEAAIAALRAAGAEVTVNIVGFAVDDAALEATFARWAETGGGRYLPAADGPELTAALGEALGEGFAVRAAAGGPVVAAGTVGGAPVALPAGIWRVELDSGGTIWPAVEIGEGAAVVLPVPATP